MFCKLTNYCLLTKKNQPLILTKKLCPATMNFIGEYFIVLYLSPSPTDP